MGKHKWAEINEDKRMLTYLEMREPEAAQDLKKSLKKTNSAKK